MRVRAEVLHATGIEPRGDNQLLGIVAAFEGNLAWIGSERLNLCGFGEDHGFHSDRRFIVQVAGLEAPGRHGESRKGNQDEANAVSACHRLKPP